MRTLTEKLDELRAWLLEPALRQLANQLQDQRALVYDKFADVLRLVDRHARPAPVINVLVFTGDKLAFGARRSFELGGEQWIKFTAFHPLEDVLIVCLCDLERVRVQSVFHGTDLQHQLGDGMNAPICRVKGTVQPGVVLTVNAVMVEK